MTDYIIFVALSLVMVCAIIRILIYRNKNAAVSKDKTNSDLFWDGFLEFISNIKF
jgi:hypothetical protein